MTQTEMMIFLISFLLPLVVIIVYLCLRHRSSKKARPADGVKLPVMHHRHKIDDWLRRYRLIYDNGPYEFVGRDVHDAISKGRREHLRNPEVAYLLSYIAPDPILIMRGDEILVDDSQCEIFTETDLAEDRLFDIHTYYHFGGQMDVDISELDGRPVCSIKITNPQSARQGIKQWLDQQYPITKPDVVNVDLKIDAADADAVQKSMPHVSEHVQRHLRSSEHIESAPSHVILDIVENCRRKMIYYENIVYEIVRILKDYPGCDDIVCGNADGPRTEVQDVVRSLVKSAKDLNDEIARRDGFSGCDGCSTGDCPHGDVNECLAAQGRIIAEQEAKIVSMQEQLDRKTQLVSDVNERLCNEQATVGNLKKKLSEVAEACNRRENEAETLRFNLNMRLDAEREDFWFWQGDGTDDLESLTCSVVIRPEQLARILNEKDRLQQDSNMLRLVDTHTKGLRQRFAKAAPEHGSHQADDLIVITRCIADMELELNALQIQRDRTQEVLRMIKQRIHFIGYPSEAKWEPDPESNPGRLIPDWRAQIEALESVLIYDEPEQLTPLTQTEAEAVADQILGIRKANEAAEQQPRNTVATSGGATEYPISDGELLWSFGCSAIKLPDGRFQVAIRGATPNSIRRRVDYHPLWGLIRLLAEYCDD